MRILLTGATGFVGRNLLPELARSHDVVALRRPATPEPASPAGVTWVAHDLSTRAVPAVGRLDAVVHLAQSRHYREFPERAGDIFEVNVEATFRLLELARASGAQTFVYASSGGVYAPQPRPLREDDALAAPSFYQTSKHASEILLAGYRSLFRTIVLRPFFVYGPGQTGMLVPNLLGRVERGEPVQIDGNPGIRVNPIHVEDAIRVFEPALRHPTHGVFNVAGDETVTITDLALAIGRVVGAKPDIRHGPEKGGGDLVADTTRMRELLGVRPKTNLVDGLRTMVRR